MKYRYLFLLALVALTACNGGKEEEQQAGEIKDAISVSEQTLNLDPDLGSTVSVDVTTDGDWKLEGMSDGVKGWLEASALMGHGSGTVTFTCTDFNPYDVERLAVFTFRSGDASAPCVIRQACDPARRVALSADALAFTGLEDEVLSLEVVTDKAWTLEGYTEEVKAWMEVSPVSGEGNMTVTLKSLSRNMDLADRVVSLCFRIDRVHSADVTVSQKTGISIAPSETELTFAPDKAESKTIVITTTSDQYPWHVEGLPEWLTIDTPSYTGKEKTVTLSTKGENESSGAREATISFVMSDDVKCSVTVTQESPALKTYVITWKAGGTVTSPTVKGGQDSPHSKFPWVDSWDSLGNVNREWKNGKGGEVVKTGKYDVVATWLFQDNVTKEWIPLEMGPIRTDASTGIYYHNQETTNIRWAWSYIKIPAKLGYRVSHIKMTSINGASNATLVFGTDKTARNGFLEENATRVSFGKNDPLDKEFSTTQANTTYYLGCILDRTFDSFEITYTEVR